MPESNWTIDLNHKPRTAWQRFLFRIKVKLWELLTIRHKFYRTWQFIKDFLPDDH